jgi:hypothetical protein
MVIAPVLPENAERSKLDAAGVIKAVISTTLWK